MSLRQRLAQRLRQREEADFRRLEALARAGNEGYNKARVAHHEMGHSALLWFQREAGVFESTTVVPNGDDEGLTVSWTHTQMTRAEMKALLCVQMAGRVADWAVIASRTELKHEVDETKRWID
uniref:Peptidase M41 domain-containing protein n=1 Tax=Globodera rostochiensis TaxID=31243 RepID=A0A914HDL3_GLORO